MHQRFFVLITLLLVGLIVVLPVQAVEQIEAQTATAAGETTQKLKERIEKIIEEKRDQIEGTIDQLTQRKRGFIGQVTRVSEESLTVRTQKGVEIIPLSSDVQLLKKNRPLKISEVVVGDWTIVMGIIEQDAFVARRILISTESLRPRTHFIALGTILSLGANTAQVQSRQGEVLTLSLSRSTSYQDNEGETIRKTALSEQMQVLVVGYEDDKGKTALILRSLASLKDQALDE